MTQTNEEPIANQTDVEQKSQEKTQETKKKEKKKKSKKREKRQRGNILWVVGSRKWKTKKSIKNAIAKIKKEAGYLECVVVGTLPGAEAAAISACKELGIQVVQPNLRMQFERGAYYMRNGWVRSFFKPKWLIAAHEHLDRSKNTAQVIKWAQKDGLDVTILKKG